MMSVMHTLVTRLTQLYHTLGSNQMERLSSLGFLLLIICLPIQRRLEFHGAHSFITGGFTEYTSYFLYATDLLVVLLVVLWKIAALRNRALRPPKVLTLLVILFIVSATFSAGTANDYALALYGTLRWTLLLALALAIAYHIVRHISLHVVALAIVVSASLQAIIASLQFTLQRSLGLSFLLGESHLSVTIANVAKVVVDGDRYLRPYGTMPHPNVLAAFVALGLLSAIFLLTSRIFRESARYRLMLFVLTAILIWGELIALSRNALLFAGTWSLLLFLFVLFHVKHKIKTFHVKQSWPVIVNWLAGVAAVGTAMIIALQKFLFARATTGNTQSDVSATARANLLEASAQIIGQNSIFGVGIDNFVIVLHALTPNLKAWEYQPVHNIFALLLSEVGFVGTGLFVAILLYVATALWRSNRSTIKKAYITSMLGFLLCTGLLDHYLLTLQQGQLMLALVLGIALGCAVSRETKSTIAQNDQSAR